MDSDGFGWTAAVGLPKLNSDESESGKEGLETPLCSRPTDGAGGFYIFRRPKHSQVFQGELSGE